MEPKEPRTFRVTTIHPDRREEVVSDAEMAARAERKFFHSVTQDQAHAYALRKCDDRQGRRRVRREVVQAARIQRARVPGEEMDQA
jgi:hypothetical protein